MTLNLKKFGLLLTALTFVAPPTWTSEKFQQSSYGMVPVSMMNISVVRTHYTKYEIEGELFINGVKICRTIENTKYQIPPGTYAVRLTYSPKFHQITPQIVVPQRVGIRIHVSNTPHLRGCIGVPDEGILALIIQRIEESDHVQFVLS